MKIAALALVLLATAAHAGPVHVCALVCQRSTPTITNGVTGIDVDRCRCEQEPEVGPTPVPTPKPTPTANSCAGKELQPIAGGDEFGFIGRTIGDGETQTFCHTIPVGRVGADFDAIDRTGAAQCFWAEKFTVIPPPGMSPVTSFGGNAHIGFFNSGQPIPAGTYRISVKARTDSGCAQRYGLSARSR